MTLRVDRALAEAAVELVRPLLAAARTSADAERLFETLDWNPLAVTGLSEALTAAFAACRSAVDQVVPLVEKGPDSFSDVQAALEAAGRAAVALRDAARAWKPPAGMSPELAATLVETFVEDLLNALFDRWLELRFPWLAGVLLLLGVRTLHVEPEIRIGAAPPVRRAAPRPRLHLDRLGRALTEPAEVVRENAFADGTAAVQVADRIGPLVAEAVRQLGLNAVYGMPAAPLDGTLAPDARAAARRLLRVSLGAPFGDPPRAAGGAGTEGRADLALTAGLGDGPTGLVVAVVLAGALDARRTSGDWTVEAVLQAVAPALLIDRDSVTFAAPDGDGGTGEVSGRLTVTADPQDGPLLRIGPATGTRLEIDGVTASIDARAAAGQPFSFTVGLHTGGARLVLGAGEDPFLARVLPDEPLVVALDLGAEFSPGTGLRFTGSAGLDRTFPVALELGPVRIPRVRVRFAVDSTGVAVEVGADLTLALGPLLVSAADLGLRLEAAGAEGGTGNLGPLALRAALKPPTTIALSVDSGPVSGSGALTVDPGRGRYAGAAQLRIDLGGYDIRLTALAVIDTRLPDGTPLRGPDGSDGWSLLLLASGSWSPGWQLGLGFALSGLGLLVGVNRAADPEALRAGVKTRALDALLFPAPATASGGTDPTALPEVLGGLFPAAPGRHVAGVMARITWGPQPLVTADLALFLEFPAPLRAGLAARITAALPDPKAPVVKLRMDAVGLVDLGTRTASLDAVLVDSAIAGFPLTGEMAMRLQWGARRRFLLSVGGFHPRFTDKPAGFPQLRRVALDLGRGDDPRIRAEAYLAVTSNTVQHGARVELRASKAGFTVEGQLGYDALIQLSPFAFEVDVFARAAVKRGSKVLLAVGIELNLSGPNPWRARGKAHFKIWFVSVSVSFDVTSGTRARTALPKTADPLADLRRALADPASWSASAPGSGPVTVRQVRPRAGEVLVHPLGELTVSQRVLPLGVVIERVGPDRVERRTAYDIAGVSFGTGRQSRPGPLGAAVTDAFAPGHFLELDDAARLSRPSFENMRSGCRIGAAGLRCPSGGTPDGVPLTTFGELGYRTVTKDEPDPALSPAAGERGGAAAARLEPVAAADLFTFAAGAPAAPRPRFAAAGPALSTVPVRHTTPGGPASGAGYTETAQAGGGGQRVVTLTASALRAASLTGAPA
ncbi:hypothetical protein KNE206_41820 [Kitasatospora sp. NE20-6]|uniref:DUF6603 domain-containing protein n=1 Tax=Kitasatospora sp. NE20-6 TaxID=2859066 RepID=UPI0034DBC271